jgi:hypothetical protein
MHACSYVYCCSCSYPDPNFRCKSGSRSNLVSHSIRQTIRSPLSLSFPFISSLILPSSIHIYLLQGCRNQIIMSFRFCFRVPWSVEIQRSFLAEALSTAFEPGSWAKSSRTLSIFSRVSRVRASTSEAVRDLVGMGGRTVGG